MKKSTITITIIVVMIIIAALIVVLISGCYKPVEQESEIPATILKNANGYIISKVGQESFNNNILYLYGTYYPEKEYYLLHYNLEISQKPSVDVGFSIIINRAGNIIGTYRLPDCIKEQKECDFKINTIFNLANNFVISKVGEDFFNNYIKNYSGRYNPERGTYGLSYYLEIKPSISSGFFIIINEKGDIIRADEVPDCIEEPKKCDFQVDAIFNNVNNFIISRVGEDFFNNYISYSDGEYRLKEAKYMLFYRLKIPEKTYVSHGLRIDIGGEGNIIKSVGVPDCIKEPKECEFPIDKSQAIKIAEKAGLEKGLRGLDAVFYWEDTFKTYTWLIQNVLYEDKESRATGGKEVIVDANSGEILKIWDWPIE